MSRARAVYVLKTPKIEFRNASTIVKKYNVISGLLTYLGASGMLERCPELDSQLRKRSVSRARAVCVLKTPKIEFRNASTFVKKDTPLQQYGLTADLPRHSPRQTIM